ncbi:HIRAN domain-containing protein [Sporosarcina beigongshangi]|uniref:HIRAN domain-containing protein n=1 Tax=Sporosarcina beigongshangi TaxID=2782538 RepID=UPI00193A3310|nr:HIRAN domain-containing protein [Sporosarcina beigongshangi]
MEEHKSLWVVWQNSESRLHYHVGTLSHYNGQYEFTYTWQSEGNQKVRDALQNGYMLHPSFSHLEKTYTATKLFPAFDRRLPSDIRADFNHILDEFHLDKTASKMELLEQTRGKSANDTYSFEKSLKVESGKLITTFFINGMRHQKDLPNNWPSILRTTNKIELKLEPENLIDVNAVAVYGGLGTKLGYVPRFYAAGIGALLERGIKHKVMINYINETATPDWWVKMDFECNMSEISPEELKSLDPLFEYAI